MSEKILNHLNCTLYSFWSLCGCFRKEVCQTLVVVPYIFRENILATSWMFKQNSYAIATFSSFTMSWGPGKHSMSPPGCRPLFLKPKCHKESKSGFKPINFRSPLQVIFSYYFFWYQKLSKKLDILLIFEILS